MSNMKIKDIYLNMLLQKKLLTQFIILSIIPIILVGVVSYIISYNVTHKNAIQFSKEIIHKASEKTDDLLLQAKRLALMAAEDPIIQETLRHPLSEDIARRYSKELEINTRLNFNTSYYEHIFSVYVIGKNGGKYKSNYTTMRETDLTKTNWYNKVSSSNDASWFSTNPDSLVAYTAGEYFISVGIPIIDKADGRLSGIVMVDIPEQQIAKVVQTRFRETGNIFIVDEKGIIITHSDRKAITNTYEFNETDQMTKEDNTIVRFSKSLIVIEEISPLNGWKTVAEIPIKELTRDSVTIRQVIIGMLLLVSSIAMFFAWQMTKSVVRPIKEMSSLMKKVEDGDFQVTMPTLYRDEIGHLSRSFNMMIRKTDELMASVVKEQEALRQAEIKSLQYQINPHFLYNTLDSIVWLARTKKPDDVIRMVMAITKLFRIGISRGKDIVTLQEEIEHVENYLTIQQMRYRKILNFTIDIPEKLLNCRVCKVILQPIVENAIYHGLKMKTEKGYIHITAEERDNYLVLRVQDTGIGIKEDQLNRLNQALRDNNGEKMNIYGMKNVADRIKLFFGDQYGLTVRSNYGEGTIVEIKIPKAWEG
jgi:two-component system sensor histidine kinase YesM